MKCSIRCKTGAALLITLVVSSVLIITLKTRSEFLLSIFPPNNLYSPLVNQELDLSGTVPKYRFSYRQDYVGSYLIGLRLKHPPHDFWSPVTTSAKITIRLIDGKQTFQEWTSFSWADRFSGGPSDSGVLLGSYKVPNNVPVGSDVELEVNIEKPDSSFYARYGEAVFFVKRAADQ